MLTDKPLEAWFRQWQLTPKQAAIARLVLDGLSWATIAWQLVIGESTAKMQMTTVYAKAGVKTRGSFIYTYGRARYTETVMDELKALNESASEVDAMFGGRPQKSEKKRKLIALRKFDRKAFNG